VLIIRRNILIDNKKKAVSYFPIELISSVDIYVHNIWLRNLKAFKNIYIAPFDVKPNAADAIRYV
jgi:hypothetical protein